MLPSLLDQVRLTHMSTKRVAHAEARAEAAEAAIRALSGLLYAENLTVATAGRQFGVGDGTARRWLEILVKRNLAVSWKVGAKRWYGASPAFRIMKGARRDRTSRKV